MHKIKFRKSPIKKTDKIRKGTNKTKKDIVCSQIKPITSSETPFEKYHPAEGLFVQECDIAGKNVFEVKSKNATTANKKNISNTLDELSLSDGAKRVEKAVESENGISTRSKMKQELARLKSAEDDSDPEDSDDAYETESEDEVYSAAVCDVSKGRKNKAVTCSQAYFAAHKQSKSTSNKTLSNIKLKPTSIQELADILQKAHNSHKKEKEMLFKKYCSQFAKWDCMLRVGFNILLYGVGSKRRVLDAFCEKMLKNELCVAIHGFFPTLSLKQIMCSITEEAMEYDGKFTSIQDHCDYVKQYFSENEEELFIVIHNIDSLPLRSAKTQSMLSALASTPRIHFVCSIDHMNAPLMWDQIMLSHFRWVWFDTTTFEPYILETSYENSLLREQSSNLMLSSLLHVYNSLTPNSRGVFMILAKYQKEQKKTHNLGIAFHEWYQECREAFLVNSEITMQAQISEFKNHKLLASRKNNDGIELWYIPVDSATLDQFLENCE